VPLTDQSPWLLTEWLSQLASALESMTGQKPVLEPADAAAPPPSEPVHWWRQQVSLGPDALVWIGVPQAASSALGGSVLQAAGIDDAAPADLKSTCQEVIHQALAGLTRSLSKKLQKEVRCESGQEVEQGPPGPAFSVQVTLGGQPPVTLLTAFSESLHAAAAGTPEAAGTLVAVAGPKHPPPVPLMESSKTLDLLLDVELPVSVSFGRAHLPLKDVLKLSSGSIVELNRAVSEPVEIIVNNCVIARGEVVVVDGNYGVKIQHIISRQERLRTLH